VLLVLIITGFWFLGARVGNASADPFLDGYMKTVESKIGHWERNSYTIACLTEEPQVRSGRFPASNRDADGFGSLSPL
jgi:hypothetical protein